MFENSSDELGFLFGADIDVNCVFVYAVLVMRTFILVCENSIQNIIQIQDRRIVGTIEIDKRHLPQATKPYFSNDSVFRTSEPYASIKT